MPELDTTPSRAGRCRICSLPEVVERPGWRKIVQRVQQRREWLNQVHIAITQIPAPTFQEAARAAYVLERFRELGLERVRMDSAGNVLAERPGRNGRWVGIMAHLDTVAPPGVAVEVTRRNGRFYAPGISDNGAGLAALLGTAVALQESQITTDCSLLFVATVGEEGEGDLYGMRHLFAQREVCRRFAGVLVLDGSAVDHITVAGIGSRRFLIEITGPGGHSWSDFGKVNPIQAISATISQLSQIRLPTTAQSSLNIGMIHGGTSVNSIPTSAWIKVDIRSTSAEEIEQLSQALEAAVRIGVEQETRRGSGSLEVRILPIGDRPVAELASAAHILKVIQEVDHYFGIRSKLERSSTDANIPLSLGIEAIATGGGGLGGDAHTPNEWYDPQGRDLGLKRILLAALLLAGVIENSEA